MSVTKKLLIACAIAAVLTLSCCVGIGYLAVFHRPPRVEEFNLGGHVMLKCFPDNDWCVVGTDGFSEVVPNGPGFMAAETVRIVRLGRRFAVVTSISRLNSAWMTDYLVDLQAAAVLETGPARTLSGRLAERGETDVRLIDMWEVDRGWLGGTHWPTIPWLSTQPSKPALQPSTTPPPPTSGPPTP